MQILYAKIIPASLTDPNRWSFPAFKNKQKTEFELKIAINKEGEIEFHSYLLVSDRKFGGGRQLPDLTKESALQLELESLILEEFSNSYICALAVSDEIYNAVQSADNYPDYVKNTNWDWRSKNYKESLNAKQYSFSLNPEKYEIVGFVDKDHIIFNELRVKDELTQKFKNETKKLIEENPDMSRNTVEFLSMNNYLLGKASVNFSQLLEECVSPTQSLNSPYLFDNLISLFPSGFRYYHLSQRTLKARYNGSLEFRGIKILSARLFFDEWKNGEPKKNVLIYLKCTDENNTKIRQRLLIGIKIEKFSELKEFFKSLDAGYHNLYMNKKNELINWEKSSIKSVYKEGEKNYYGESDKKILEIIKRKIQSFKDSPAKKITIIDAGCGDGRFLNKIFLEQEELSKISEKEIELVGFDVNEENIKIAENSNPSISFWVDNLDEFDQILNSSIKGKRPGKYKA